MDTDPERKGSVFIELPDPDPGVNIALILQTSSSNFFYKDFSHFMIFSQNKNQVPYQQIKTVLSDTQMTNQRFLFFVV